MDGLEGAVMDGAVDDQVVQDVETTGVTTDDQGLDASADQAADQSQQDIQTDGRTLPKEIQAHLKALRETNPKIAEELRKAYFGHSHYSKAFPNADAAMQAKQALELIGGQDGIAELQSKVSAAELLDQAAESGDPSIVEDWATDFPEGFKKVMPHALDKLSSLDPKSYAETIQPHAYALMENVGLPGAIHNILQAIEAKNFDQAKSWAAETQNWLNGQKQNSERLKTAASDPMRQQLSERENTLNQREEKMFRDAIGKDTYSYQGNQVSKSLAPFLKSKNITPEAKADLQDGINREINRVLKGDTAYQKQVKAMLAAKNRDPQRISSYINAKMDIVAPQATKAVWQRRYGALAQAAVKKTAQTTVNTEAAQGGPVKVAKPPMDQVDKSVPKWMEKYIAGHAVMATGPHKGRQVSWR